MGIRIFHANTETLCTLFFKVPFGILLILKISVLLLKESQKKNSRCLKKATCQKQVKFKRHSLLLREVLQKDSAVNFSSELCQSSRWKTDKD